MTSHWAEKFYNNFKNLYDADLDDLNSEWRYHGSIKHEGDKGRGVYLLKTPLPDYSLKCICGHAIKENCIVSNGKHSRVVGNCCVKKFLELPSDPIFRSIAKVKKDITESIHAELAYIANKKGWITDWELSFVCDTWRKRVLTGRQLDCRVKINNKILCSMGMELWAK